MDEIEEEKKRSIKIYINIYILKLHVNVCTQHTRHFATMHIDYKYDYNKQPRISV